MIDIEKVYAEVAPRLSNCLMGDGVPYATACDIVQETFLRLWKRREALTDDLHEVSGLAFTIARNYRNDLYRKAQREVLEDEITDAGEGDGDGPAAGDVPTAASAQDLIDADERTRAFRRRLRAALARMPVPLLEAFVLSRIGDLSVQELADRLSLSEANVKVRVHRAKDALRALMERADDAPAQPSVAGGFPFAVLRAVMALAAVDGVVSKEELEIFRALAKKALSADADAADRLWRDAMMGMSYIGFLAGELSPEEMVRLYAAEAAAAFRTEGAAPTAARKTLVVALLERLAAADGEYSEIERRCIRALAARL